MSINRKHGYVSILSYEFVIVHRICCGKVENQKCVFIARIFGDSDLLLRHKFNLVTVGRIGEFFPCSEFKIEDGNEKPVEL